MPGQGLISNLLRGLLGGAAVLAMACNPTFAPPARIAVGAMPELDEPGHGYVRVQAGGRGSFALRTEGGLGPGLTLDLGLSGAVDQDGMVMATAGLRRSLWHQDQISLAVAGGLGVGCGGKIDGQGGCASRTAYGSYLGLDLGWRPLTWLGLYQGSRLQWTVGEGGAPWTLWTLFVAGIQLGTDPAYITLEAGFWGYDSYMDSLWRKVDSHDSGNLSLGAGFRW